MIRLKDVFPACHALLDAAPWTKAADACGLEPEKFPETLELQAGEDSSDGYLSELARLELIVHTTRKKPLPAPDTFDAIAVNPTLEAVNLSWKNLCSCLAGPHRKDSVARGDETVLVWKTTRSDNVFTRPADHSDLLALKIIAENISPETVAGQGEISLATVDACISAAVQNGLLLSPPSQLRRDTHRFSHNAVTDEKYLAAPVFTLQWHLTQHCDLHCKHCYDRSDRSSLSLEQARRIVQDLYDFSRERHVRGQISFSGGNPLLYPHFMDLYHSAADLGLNLAILGNPAQKKKIEEIISVKEPAFYQISLEGMEDHNNSIRGAGHFRSALDFLEILRDLEVYSMVMLTLTRDNMDQVIPLAELLRDKTDYFTFNRLSLVGEGAQLQPVDRQHFQAFLASYMAQAQNNPIMGLKDSLFNILKHEKALPLAGGCAGFGCGAAFNFITILPDGEVHACRKFPSPIGNILSQSIAEIYDSEPAKRYRSGCQECDQCPIRPVCGGCLAIAYSFGLDIFSQKDPYCFITHK
ncbi:thio(seleno)oxazole modification radical SAM maturase SbtM [Thermodesulfobacteriota bacterium]